MSAAFACAVAGYTATATPDLVDWALLVHSRLWLVGVSPAAVPDSKEATTE